MSDVLSSLIPAAGSGDPGAVDAALGGQGPSVPPPSQPALSGPVKGKGGRPKGRRDSAPRKPRGGGSARSSTAPIAATTAPSAEGPAAPRMSAADLHGPATGGGYNPSVMSAPDPAVVASLQMPLQLAFKALGGFAAARFGPAAALDADASEALASAWAPCLAPMLGGASSPWTAALVVTGAVVAPRALAVASARRVARAEPAQTSTATPAEAPPPREPSPVNGPVLDLSGER